MDEANVPNAEGGVMLVFSRKPGEAVVVTGLPGNTRELKVSVVEIRGGRVRLGFESESNIGLAPSEIGDRNRSHGPNYSDDETDLFPSSKQFPD